MYAAYRAGAACPGWRSGAALLILAAAATVYRLMVGPRMTRFVLMTVGLSIASSAWSLRPQLLTLFLLPALVWLLARERYLVIPPLFLVWANAHGGVALGGVVLGGRHGGGHLARWRTRAPARSPPRPDPGGRVAAARLWRSRRRRSGFTSIASWSPRRFDPYEVQIAEWFMLRPDSGFGALFWAAALAFALVIVLRWRAIATGDWTDWVTVAAALALMPLGIRSARNIGPFLILAMPAASHALGPAFRFRLGRGPRPASPEHPRLNLALLVGLGAAGLAVVAMTWRTGTERLYWNPFPRAALRALDRCPGPLYNFYGDGGGLVWFAPQRQDFVDGRQDPFPVWLLQESFAIEHGAPYRWLFAKFGVRCAFISAKSKLTDQLRGAGWHTLFLDRDWAVLAAPPERL